MENPCWIELDQGALRHNCQVVRALAPSSNIVAMVKANGYGHGAHWVASVLKNEVQAFGVARFNELRKLRETNYAARILLLGSLLDPDMLRAGAALSSDFVVHDLHGATLIADTPLPQAVSVWLKRNVGMNRLGMSDADFRRAHALLSDLPWVSNIIHMSHFSESEDPDKTATQLQCRALLESSKALGVFPRSLANSAAIIRHSDSHQDWVRPGIMLYGDDPTGSLAGSQSLRPVMGFKSRIVALRELVAGDGVGYNRRWRAQEKRILATVAAGYADGYPRAAPDGTPVLIRGQRAALAGRVSMDLLTVDVSDVAGVGIGDEVTLWGEGLPAAEIGRHCNTISYELFTRITPRVERRYI